MDSLTQIVLGAAVGEATLGKKIGNKALLWGAIGGTIPDLDVFVGRLFDTVTELDIHRGFSHSIIFSLLLAPILGYLVSKLYTTKEADWKGWSLLFFWSLFTHPLLDSFTTWGTQLFWPLDYRLAIQSIFVIDPIYTLPFLVSTIAVLFYRRDSQIRRRWNRFGLLFSTAYLGITVLIKTHVDEEITDSLRRQEINYERFESRPTPLNSILWTANIETEDAFLISYYSLFDQANEISFKKIKKRNHLIAPLQDNADFERLKYLTKGYYTFDKLDDTLIMNDLRFGQLIGWQEGDSDFVFAYEFIPQDTGEWLVERKPNDLKKARAAMGDLWTRIKGN
jgi:inner membrane protein